MIKTIINNDRSTEFVDNFQSHEDSFTAMRKGQFDYVIWDFYFSFYFQLSLRFTYIYIYLYIYLYILYNPCKHTYDQQFDKPYSVIYTIYT